MIQTLDELRALLSDMPLGGRAMTRLPVLDTGEHALLVEIDGVEVEAAWRAAREQSGRAGRWPVAVTCWADGAGAWERRFEGEDLFMRAPFTWGAGGADVSPAGLRRRSRDVDVAAMLKREAARRAELVPAAEVIEEAVAETERVFGVAPDPALVADAGGSHQSDLDLERWLARWERDHAGDRPPRPPDPWFAPYGPTALMWLPAPAGADALAYVSWYAGETRDHADLIALLRSWEERFGAELVAHWGTMLQLVVRRPPLDLESALEVATEQVLVAPCTIWLQGTSLRDHARALVGAERWFLHERP